MKNIVLLFVLLFSAFFFFSAISLADNTALFETAHSENNMSLCEPTLLPISPAGTPSAPRNLQASASGRQVILTWDSPFSDGGSPITNYIVYRSNTPGNETYLSTVGNMPSYNDPDLALGSYYYTVSAINSNGEGPRSIEASANITIPSEWFTIRGKITGSGGKPIAGATVKLDSIDKIYHNMTKTGDNGTYIFNNVPIGKTYVISVSPPGYAPYTSPPLSGEPGITVENDINSKLIESPGTILPFVLVACAAALGITSAFAAYAVSEVFRYAFLSAFFVPLYTRIRRERVLDHFVRGQVYDFIRNHPGTYYNDVRNRLRLTNGTLTYHLKTLEMQGFIKSKRDRIYRRYYEIGVKTDVGIGIRYSKLQLKIMKTVDKVPGLCQADISRELKVPLSVVSYNVRELIKVGAIRVENAGRKQHCFSTKKEETIADISSAG